MSTKKQTQSQDNEQFKKDIATARGYVSAELKFIKQDINADEARSSFDNAINMYRNNNLPF